MSIRLLEKISIGGVDQAVGATVTGTADWEAAQVAANRAVYVVHEPSAAALPLNTGVWTRTPSIWRLRLTGTGTCTLDARDSLGAITLAFATYTATAATDQIEFPFAGANAVEIRATLTGTCTAEVI